MAGDKLVAVSDKGDSLCVACAEKRHGIDLCDVPPDSDAVIPVYASDDWKIDFDGMPCDDCGEEIDIEADE